LYDAGIVDGDVEPAEFFGGSLPDPPTILIADIAGKGRRFRTQCCGEVRERCLVKIEQNPAAALSGKGFCGAAAEATRRAGDEYGRPLKRPLVGSRFSLLVDQFHRKRASSFTAWP